MTQSAETGELAKALAEAQATIKAPKKGRTAKIKSEKGSYEYNYADLADVIESYRGPLSKNGLALTQTTRFTDSHIVLLTTLLHSSGQWIASEYPIALYARPQEQGSAITYARRYAVTAFLGIAAEDDDDGAAAQASEPVKATTKAPPLNGLTDADIEKVSGLAKRAGYSKHGDLKPLLLAIGGVETLRALDRMHLAELIALLERKGDEAMGKDVDEAIGAPAHV
jgi:hypothetical protein